MYCRIDRSLIFLLVFLFSSFLPFLSADQVIDPDDASVLQSSSDLKCGLPSRQGTIIQHDGFALGYSEEHEQATWVQYQITKEEVLNKVCERTDNFCADPLIRTGSAALSDYKYSGYDRGHLAPAADMHFSVESMSDSFYLSNMSPQRPGFNRGIWRRAEGLVRTWAVNNKALYVVTGPIFRSEAERIGSNRVTVPAGYYKVVLDIDKPEYKAIGLLFPHCESSGSLRDFAVTVDKVERTTGLDFFSTLSDGEEEKLESKCDTRDWTWSSRTYQGSSGNESSSRDTEAGQKQIDRGRYPYAASGNSNKFHRSGCGYVKRISPANLVLYEKRGEAVQDGKTPCKVCHP